VKGTVARPTRSAMAGGKRLQEAGAEGLPPVFPIETVLEQLTSEVQTYQVPVVDLMAVQGEDPFHILVATILSARTRDEVTAAVSRRLFERIHGPEELAALSLPELETLLKPVGFYRVKARALARLPEALRDFGGQVPSSIEELLRLPGVGRKTANLVRAVAFRLPAICVDTHVHRIMNIWGYVKTANPLETEIALRQQLPERWWLTVNGMLVAFGQQTCTPLRPHCDACVIASCCPRLGVTPRRVQKNPGRSLSRDGSPPAAVALRLVSWNVNGLRAVLQKGFRDSLAELDGDIVALQEIKALPEQLPLEAREFPGYQVYWHSARRKGYSGTAVLSRRRPLSVVNGLGRQEFDDEGRVMTLEYDDFFLVNCYFPNAQAELARIDFKLDFNREVLRHLERLAERKSVVLCGDLNVAHKPIDLAHPAANEGNPGYSPQERAWLDEVVAGGFVDTFRKFDQRSEQYSWWSYRAAARERNIGWRIDYFLVDPASESRVLGAALHPEIPGSDHCPVSLVFGRQTQ